MRSRLFVRGFARPSVRPSVGPCDTKEGKRDLHDGVHVLLCGRKGRERQRYDASIEPLEENVLPLVILVQVQHQTLQRSQRKIPTFRRSLLLREVGHVEVL